MFFPMLFKRIWMLSCLCCCIAVFTLHMYASRLGIYACLKNANVSQLHFVHTTLNRYFLCSNISCILGGITLTFLNESHLFFFPLHKRPAGSSSSAVCGMMYYCVLAGPTLPPTGLDPTQFLSASKPSASQALSRLRSHGFINFNGQIV